MRMCINVTGFAMGGPPCMANPGMAGDVLVSHKALKIRNLSLLFVHPDPFPEY